MRSTGSRRTARGQPMSSGTKVRRMPSTGTSNEAYVVRFGGFVELLRARGIAAPVYVAIAAYFGIPAGYGPQQAVIAAAQRRLVNPASGIVEGPNTDAIRDRHDDCHMSETGLCKHAAAWVEALISR